MSDELNFPCIAAALRLRYGAKAATVAFREADFFRQKGDGERVELWMRVAEELVEPSPVVG
jgi:hypothetical protein